MKADVSIVIVTYNSAGEITACLNSVLGDRAGGRKQVIVLDNNSTDDTVALIRKHHPQVTLLTPGVNLGFAAGVNVAVQSADAEFVLLLNPYTVLLDNAIDRVVDFARRHRTYGMYGGRALKKDGTLEPSSCWG